MASLVLEVGSPVSSRPNEKMSNTIGELSIVTSSRMWIMKVTLSSADTSVVSRTAMPFPAPSSTGVRPGPKLNLCYCIYVVTK